jgi:hypothetical protein
MADFDTYLVMLLVLITITVVFVLVYQIVGEEEKVAG